MEPTRQFFSGLRRLAVTLETETAKLQRAFESRNDAEDGDSSENTARAMRAYHELNGDIGTLKVQIRDQLAQEKERNNEVSNFIKACQVMEKRVAQDIQTVRAHWEKYGYRAPSDTHAPTKTDEEDEANSAEEKRRQDEEDGENNSSTPPKTHSPFTDAMRTPQLSDFGLSEMQLKRTLAGLEWCSEAPPMPQMSLPQPSLETPAPPMPITPKCALRMDDDELQTPQMHDFGISEHTMCLNNDFTMNLLRKNVDEPPRQESLSEPKVTSIMESLQTKAEKLDSPEMPELCTLGLKIRKTNDLCSSPEQKLADPESPCRPEILPSTPELPAFQTPYMSRLVSAKKSARQPETVNAQAGDDGHAFDLPTPRNGAAGSKRPWEYNLPDTSVIGMEYQDFPEVPNLESVLGRSLITRNPKLLKTSELENTARDPAVHSLDVDGPTQEFSLGTPRIRTNYQEPSTPEMPDLSSVTQDICKLVSQAQLKKTTTAIVQPQIRPETNKYSTFSRAVSLPEVSGSEFQSLPSYLRQMTLSSLNQAVHNINRFTTERRGEVTELQMEELKRIIGVGAKAPVYILCLTELKRLSHVGELKNTSVLKLVARS